MKHNGKKSRYNAVYELHGRWYVGYVREVPGANTQGRSLREVKANLKEALDLVLKARKQLGRLRARPKVVLREPISTSSR